MRGRLLFVFACASALGGCASKPASGSATTANAATGTYSVECADCR